MKNLVKKDLNKRLKFYKTEKLRVLHLFVAKNVFLDKKYRNKAINSLSVNNNYFVQIHNYCIISRRAKGLIKEFKVSRMWFKYLANNGYLFGIKKSSW